VVTRAELERTIASGEPLSLDGAALTGLDLSGLSLAGADLGHAVLEGARLDRADLHGARLRFAQAASASLVGCDLREADLRGADLSDADLRGARLGGAVLSGTTLTGALLDGAELDPGQLGDAVLGGLLDRGTGAASSPGSPGSAPRRSGSNGSPSYVRLAEGDDGGRTRLAPGGVLEVALPEGTTGYRWELAGTAGAALSVAEAHREPPSGEAAGAFGSRVFRFAATAPGDAEVHLRLVQPWDPDAAPAQTFTAHVHVG
jgi:predicted secreted protein